MLCFFKFIIKNSDKNSRKRQYNNKKVIIHNNRFEINKVVSFFFLVLSTGENSTL